MREFCRDSSNTATSGASEFHEITSNAMRAAARVLAQAEAATIAANGTHSLSTSVQEDVLSAKRTIDDTMSPLRTLAPCFWATLNMPEVCAHMY